MSTLDFDKFSNVCLQGERIAALLNSRSGMALGGKLLIILDKYVTDNFPDQIAPIDAATKARLAARDSVYHTIWTDMHTRALNHVAGGDDSAFLDTVSSRLSFPGACSQCKVNYDEYRKQHPVDFTTPGKYFEWTVTLHNVVNSSNKKDLFTLDQAKAKYTKAP